MTSTADWQSTEKRRGDTKIAFIKENERKKNPLGSFSKCSHWKPILVNWETYVSKLWKIPSWTSHCTKMRRTYNKPEAKKTSEKKNWKWAGHFLSNWCRLKIDCFNFGKVFFLCMCRLAFVFIYSSFNTVYSLSLINRCISTWPYLDMLLVKQNKHNVEQ